ncbi:hypothetical protein [Amphritea sp. HPY]
MRSELQRLKLVDSVNSVKESYILYTPVRRPEEMKEYKALEDLTKDGY